MTENRLVELREKSKSMDFSADDFDECLDEISRLKVIIANRPHDSDCATLQRCLIIKDFTDCDCWKAAL